MTRAERIRSMTDEELTGFLFKYGINQLAEFIIEGGAGCMNIPRLRDYLAGEYDKKNDTMLSDEPVGDDEE